MGQKKTSGCSGQQIIDQCERNLPLLASLFRLAGVEWQRLPCNFHLLSGAGRQRVRFSFTLLTYQSIGDGWQRVCCSSVVIPCLHRVVLSGGVCAVVDQRSSRFSDGWR